MKYDVTILFPCLNEENTIEKCIKDVKKVMDNTKYKYEILISDNGSIDDSIKIAKKNKVNICTELKKGYGNALINGIKNSKGKYIVMLDCDCSYNTKDIPKFIKELENGNDLVIGNRFNKTTKKNTNPFIHKIGAKILTKCANILFHTKLKDYHCGLRAFKNGILEDLELTSEGMEFASEIVIKAKLKKYRIKEIDTTYLKDERNSKSKLRPIRDGFRHLKLINKLKFKNSIIFRYLTTFIITLFILLTCLFSIALIPQKSIYKNTINSFKYYYKNDKIGYLNNSNLMREYYRIDYKADMKSLSIAYLISEKTPIESIVKMNYHFNIEHGNKDFSELIKNNTGRILSYGRYWHGQIIFIRSLLIFFNIKTIYYIGIGVFFVLFLILLIKLFNRDKLLGISFLVGGIVINFFIIPYCFEYIFSFLIAYITTLIVLRMLKKSSKNFDILFLVIGVITSFFDFLTCETVTICLPLLVYLYLKSKEEKITYKEIIKYCILWFIGYSIMFLLKWLIGYLVLGKEFISDMLYHAKLRIYDKSNTANSYFLLSGVNFVKLIKCLFPFNRIKYAITIFVAIQLLLIYYFMFYEKEKSKVFKMILIMLIPIARYLVLPSHAFVHYYFVYRALLPIIIFETIYSVQIVLTKVKKQQRKL